VGYGEQCRTLLHQKGTSSAVWTIGTNAFGSSKYKDLKVKKRKKEEEQNGLKSCI
jgi:hypothetical protein